MRSLGTSHLAEQSLSSLAYTAKGSLHFIRAPDDRQGPCQKALLWWPL